MQAMQLVVIDEGVTRGGNCSAVRDSARMGLAAFLVVVEALYQSADAFPPLKSAVGAILAIVTLCEVCARSFLIKHSHNCCSTIECSRKPARC